ncbi:MAG: fibrillarin-like rRNA/tRNA 2'-O-methyltransferase [Candidatus Micrarchaeales archaeon]
MKTKEIFENVFEIEGGIATINLSPGNKVYGEKIIKNGKEYRIWDPNRSKLAAAIKLGLKILPIKKDSRVLYLGAATGTTPSHVSDIVEKGVVYCVEISPIAMKHLVKVAEKRENMIPLLNDARKPEEYAEYVKEVDVIYEDVSCKEQAEILIANTFLLKPKGFALFAIKSQSIDVSKNPREVFNEVKEKISKYYKILQEIDIGKYHKYHLFLLLQKIK